MTMARLQSDDLDLIEEAMIELGKSYGVYLAQKDDHKDVMAKISKVIAKMNTIRKCSVLDAIDITPAHGG